MQAINNGFLHQIQAVFTRDYLASYNDYLSKKSQ